MSFDIETLYALLPAVYRTRDAAVAEKLDDLLTPVEQAELQALRAALAAGAGLDETQQRDLTRLEEKRLRGPLKALLTIIAEQVAGIEENIAQLYDDQFIETCADWAVPYIADLIGYRALDPRLQSRLGTARAEVANTIGFRRRKGTAAVLEELALNITGWDAVVVEFFLRLATTQYLNHIRPDHLGTVNLRRVDELAALGTPFDRLTHTADVRRIAGGRGRYNIPNLGIFLWRVGSRQLTDSPAFRRDARRYLFDPLGANTQLYQEAERHTDVAQPAGPLNTPLPITRRSLRANFAALYGPGQSLTIKVGDQVLEAVQIEACDLSDTGPDPQTSAWAHSGQTKVAVDPVLGRIAFPADINEPVLVSYYYGFTANAAIGGGEYDRSATTGAPPAPVRLVPADRTEIAQALGDIGGAGTVEVAGSGRYDGPAALLVAADSRLELRAANDGRPLIWLGGDLELGGGDSGEITLNGLLIAGGRLLVPAQIGGQPNQLQRLRLVHCTLPPGPAASLEVAAPNVIVEIERCIVGGLRVAAESTAAISCSIVDSLDPQNVAYAAADAGGAGGKLSVDACTIIGKAHTAQLSASDSIFHAALAAADSWAAPVIAERRQAGYVRYCYACRWSPGCRRATPASRAAPSRPPRSCRASARYATAGPTTANYTRPALARSARARPTRARWVCSTTCTRRSAWLGCGRGSMNICGSAWKPDYSLPAREVRHER
jgi:hypothetical protein